MLCLMVFYKVSHKKFVSSCVGFIILKIISIKMMLPIEAIEEDNMYQNDTTLENLKIFKKRQSVSMLLELFRNKMSCLQILQLLAHQNIHVKSFYRK